MINSKKRTKTIIGIGGPSIILVFIAIVIAIMSVLTYTTTIRDKNLCEETYEAVKEGIAYENEAETQLKIIDEKLANIYGDIDYYKQAEKVLTEELGEKCYYKDDILYCEYQIKMNQKRILSVELKINPKNNDSKTLIDILEWKTKNIEKWEGNEDLPLYNKEMN